MLEKIKSSTDTFKELAIIYGVALSSATILFALFEQRDLWDAFWWAVVTGLTIGYGDIYPQTVQGEILTIVWAHFMVLGMLPLMVGRIVMKVIEDRNRFTHEEQEKMFAELNDMRLQLVKTEARDISTADSLKEMLKTIKNIEEKRGQ